MGKLVARETLCSRQADLRLFAYSEKLFAKPTLAAVLFLPMITTINFLDYAAAENTSWLSCHNPI